MQPTPAYFPTSRTSPLHPPTALYARLRDLDEARGELVKTQDFVVPARSGKAWKVGMGQIWRLSTPEGAQVADLNIWHQHDPREHFWAARTRQLQASHMIQGDRLWSNLPFMRPLCGIIRDNCLLKDSPGSARNGGREETHDGRTAVTKWNGRCHDLLGTRCDPYVNYMLTSTSYDFHCHSNLVRAVLPFGLTEFDVHDVLNVFQVTGLDAQGRYFMEESPAGKGSWVDFFAETDLLVAVSACPGGDLSQWGWNQASEASSSSGGEQGEGKGDMKSTCRPLRVEVWEIRADVKREVLEGWKESVRSGYVGMHGMGVPVGES